MNEVDGTLTVIAEEAMAELMGVTLLMESMMIGEEAIGTVVGRVGGVWWPKLGMDEWGAELDD